MNAQEILTGITQRRAGKLGQLEDDVPGTIDDIFWALQALAENQVQLEAAYTTLTQMLDRTNQSITNLHKAYEVWSKDDQP